jgi:hypothetical protein
LFLVPARPPWRASESQRLLETTENLLTGKTYAQSEPAIISAFAARATKMENRHR